MKCPNCGYFNPFWMKMNWDKEAEYCKPDDVEPELRDMVAGELREWKGFMVRRTKKWFERMALEIYKARGKFGHSHGYWDNSNFDSSHHRVAQ